MDVEVEQGYVKHAALAQLHRGHQLYENPEAALAPLALCR